MTRGSVERSCAHAAIESAQHGQGPEGKARGSATNFATKSQACTTSLLFWSSARLRLCVRRDKLVYCCFYLLYLGFIQGIARPGKASAARKMAQSVLN
jgi:hypothetical protein